MEHGGDLTEAIARNGGDPSDWLDLSTGINPWPWDGLKELPANVWCRLPSLADQEAAMFAARKAYAVPRNACVAAAAGTQTLIQWIPHLAPPGPVAILAPTYAEHETAWRRAGRETIAVSNIADVPAHARNVVVVNPNNPDGRIIGSHSLEQLAARLDSRGGWLIVDEAFADVDPAISVVGMSDERPAVILRSFGKFYGLAGVRLGFAVGRRDIVERIAASVGPWPVSGPALHIGTAALRDEQWAADTRAKLVRKAQDLDRVLVAAGLRIVGGTSLFRLAACSDAVALHAQLARRHVWCRRFDWSGEYLRFGLASNDGLDRLATALRLIE
ncbi:threonine-phosphate decarboxylase CobD [Bradyrhizobium lablabi]|uniref:threonine-phosphate decarboxylase CobD n=1 Tax=Bradyrhizobium lablabi TaxID=722472 RepID=UPI001BAA629A|nr:threonine-phosphate decarboxylase CobD [Bradyrhizobium lablabi]MBR0698176.1 threonine-phosphate decarboxylase [Bradyrhizobium lablabi]